jgi:hypothetical protein
VRRERKGTNGKPKEQVFHGGVPRQGNSSDVTDIRSGTVQEFMRQAKGLITNQMRHPEQFCLRFTGCLQPQNDVGAEFPLRVECACMRKSFPRSGIKE